MLVREVVILFFPIDKQSHHFQFEDGNVENGASRGLNITAYDSKSNNTICY